MSVRKTESKIPVMPGFTIDDLGQHTASATNAQVQLFSYLTSPLGINMIQNYVVFVGDAAVQPNVASYEWVFNNNGTNTNLTTTNGVTSYTPTVIGSLSVTVNLKNSANATLHSAVLQQQVVAPNLELEQLIDQEGSSSPTAGNPVISREVINGLRVYADAAANPATDNAENILLLSLIYSAASSSNATARNALLESCSAAIETNLPTFFTTAQNGIGITKMRPHLACMFIMNGANPLIHVTQIPLTGATAIRTVMAAIGTEFNNLTEAQRIDIFNLLRFPKSNIKICKLVLDGLRAANFTEDFSIITRNRTKGRRLISEFEKGPYTVPTGAATTDLTSTSNSIFNFLLMAVWRISVSASINPSGTIDPQAKIFGVPEPIPEKTFIAQSGLFPGDASFLDSAVAYHNNFNIAFTRIESLEGIINALQANSNTFNHMRILTHANEDLLGISVFNGGSGFVTEEYLSGFQTGELDVAKAIIGFFFRGGGGHIVTRDISNTFLTYLRSINSAALIPFHLDQASATLTPDLTELFRWYIDLWLVNQQGAITVTSTSGAVTNTRNLTPAEMADPFPALIDNTPVRLLRLLIDPTLPGLTTTHYNNLKTAILGVTVANIHFTGFPSTWQFPEDPFPNNVLTDMRRDLRSLSTSLGPGNTFMTKLQHAKDRFNSTSFIDIRGCRAGAMTNPLASPPPPLLNALRNFFGNTASLPTVNAPEWFQSFNSNFNVSALANNAAIDARFAGGFNTTAAPIISLTATEVSDNFDVWSQLSKVDDQFQFFTTLFATGANLIDFASLRWRTWRQTGSTTGIPPLSLYSSRVDDLVQLQLGDLLNRLRENFGAGGSNLVAADAARLNSLQPKIETFKHIQDQFSVFSGAAFLTFYNDLHTLATDIAAISGMPATTSLVDATPPGGLNGTHITGYITNFTTYLNNFLNSAIGINTIFSNIVTAIGVTNAKRYYYFNIRLPLRVQTAAGNFVNYIVFYIAGQVSEAIKTYLKCQWTGTESQISDMNTFIDGRTITDGSTGNAGTLLATAILVETETSASPFAAAPLPEYSRHIIST